MLHYFSNLNIFQIVASLLIFGANVRYVLAIIAGTTRPSLAAALVFMLSLGSALFSSWSLGASSTAIAIASNFALTVVSVFIIIVFKKGHTTFSTFDKGGLIVVILGLILWAVTSNPWISFLAATAVDGTGSAMVIYKLLNLDPGSENVGSWGAAGIGYGFSILALDSFLLQEVLFSGMNVVICLFVALLSYMGQTKLQEKV